MKTKLVQKEKNVKKYVVELADAHAHLDLIPDAGKISEAVQSGVLTIITNGVNTSSNIRGLELADGKNVFAMIGIDPENALIGSEKELEFNINIIKSNLGRIVGIGEIGLDYMKASNIEQRSKQKEVFERFLEVAAQLRLPVSIHSRNSLDDILAILPNRGLEKVHLHFFEGSAMQAKEAERRGYMISIPPVRSEKRSKVIKSVAIDNIMAESDSPVVGETPKDVAKSVRLIAEAKGIGFNKAAEILTENTKRFFGIKGRNILMRH